VIVFWLLKVALKREKVWLGKVVRKKVWLGRREKGGEEGEKGREERGREEKDRITKCSGREVR
jgi:hypothetical protein